MNNIIFNVQDEALADAPLLEGDVGADLAGDHAVRHLPRAEGLRDVVLRDEATVES